MQQVGTATRAATRISRGIRRNAEDGARMWLPVESSPEVINKFLHSTGVPENVEISDVPSLEEGDEALAAAIPSPEQVYAILLLLPKNVDVAAVFQNLGIPAADATDSVFFVRETFENSSGPVALINAIANNLDVIPIEDSPLGRFLASVEGKSPEERGDALGENEELATCLSDACGDEEHAAADHRFVAIVRKDEGMYWLDGSRETGGALAVGSPTSPGEFPGQAVAVCRGIVGADPDTHGFSVLVLVGKSG